jgi:hypothetical protein
MEKCYIITLRVSIEAAAGRDRACLFAPKSAGCEIQDRESTVARRRPLYFVDLKIN